MHWTRECARMMNHTTVRAHIGDDTGLGMLRALNDRFDMQVQEAVQPIRYGNAMTALATPTTDGAVGRRTGAPDRNARTFEPLTVENLRTVTLLQENDCKPSHERAQAFFVVAPAALIESTPEQRSRINAMMHICRGESVVEVARLTQIPLPSLRAMCAIFNQCDAQPFLSYIRTRY
jgi:hypothetical protein